MDIIKNLNLALAFFVELAMLASFVWAGVSLRASALLKVLVAAVIPIAIIALWGAFFAPNSNSRLTQPWLELAELVLFSSASFALYKTGHKEAGFIFITAAVVNMILAVFWHQH